MYRGWTRTDYQNKHYNINQTDEGTLDDRGRDGGTNFILRIKEQEPRPTLQEHDDDDDDDKIIKLTIMQVTGLLLPLLPYVRKTFSVLALNTLSLCAKVSRDGP